MHKKILTIIFFLAFITFFQSSLQASSFTPTQQSADQKLAEKMRSDLAHGKARTAPSQAEVDYFNYNVRNLVQKNDALPENRAQAIEWYILNFPRLNEAFNVIHDDKNSFKKILEENFPTDTSDDNQDFIEQLPTLDIKAENIINDEIKNALIPELQKYNPDYIHNLDLNSLNKISDLSPMHVLNNMHQSKSPIVQYVLADKNELILPMVRESIREWMIHARDKKNKDKTLLHKATWAACQSTSLTEKENNIKIMKFLIYAGADTNTQDKYGNTPLSSATDSNHPDIVQALIAAGANPNIKNGNGNTPLHLATDSNHPDIVQALIAAGANPNIKNGNGNTPLHNTVSWNRPNIAQALIAAGANVNAQDKLGNTAEYYAKTPEMKALFAQFHAGVL